MDANAILNGLMSITAWIEDNIINGLLGKGFGLLSGGFGTILVDLIKLFTSMG
jgi:hypothetical protein